MRWAPTVLTIALLSAGCLGVRGFELGEAQDPELLPGDPGEGPERLVWTGPGPAGAQVELARLWQTAESLHLETRTRTVALGADWQTPSPDPAISASRMLQPTPSELELRGSAERFRITPATFTAFQPPDQLASFTVAAPPVVDETTTVLPEGHRLVALEVGAFGPATAQLELLGTVVALHGVHARGDPLQGGLTLQDDEGAPVLTITAHRDQAGLVVLIDGRPVEALSHGDQRLGLLLAAGHGGYRLAALATDASPMTQLRDARTGTVLATAETGGLHGQLPAGELLLPGRRGPIATPGAGASSLSLAGQADAAWHPVSGAVLISDGQTGLSVGHLSSGLPAHVPVPVEPGNAPLDPGWLLELVSGLGAGTSLVTDLALTADAGDPVVTVTPAEPIDPTGPWTVGAFNVTVDAPGHGTTTLAGPLVVESKDHVVDAVHLGTVEGQALASISCSAGACTLNLPGLAMGLPAATLEPTGPWRDGRATGARLVAADGGVLLTAELFGQHGLRIEGPIPGAPFTVAPPLVLEGDPRDPDHIGLLAPDGRPALEIDPGGPGVGRLTVAGTSVAVDQVDARLHGDPLSTETVALDLRVDGVQHRLTWGETAAPATRQLAEETADHIVLESPAGPGQAEVQLAAGPLHLDGPGTFSPRHDLLVKVEVENATGYERGHVRWEGQHVARLTASGQDDQHRVFHAQVPAWTLPSVHGETGNLTVVLERDVAPGLDQRHTVADLALTTDARPPTPPAPTPAEEGITWTPVPEAATYQAQAREGDGPWSPVPVTPVHDPEANGSGSPANAEGAGPTAGANATGYRAKVPLPDGENASLRARAVDAAGNPSPWSEEVTVQGTTAPPQPAAHPKLSAITPGAGQRLQGEVDIVWGESRDVTLVDGEVSGDHGRTWIQLGQAAEPPLTWDTRLVPDGTYLLRLVAHGPSGSGTTLLPNLEVDNLDPLDPRVQGEEERPEAAFSDPGMPTEPSGGSLPIFLALLLVLSVAGGSLLTLRRRRKGTGK